MKNNVKVNICLIAIILGVLAEIVGAIWSTIFYFQNPDMTELRQLIENPIPSIIAIVGILLVGIGRSVLEKN
jgi:chromate transport protein ChrA